MKTAEEVAKEIGKKAVSDDYIEDGGYIRDWLVNDIAQALTAFRDEGALQQLRICASHCEQQRQQARSEALEEAAKIADKYASDKYSSGGKGRLRQTADDIRALKDKP